MHKLFGRCCLRPGETQSSIRYFEFIGGAGKGNLPVFLSKKQKIFFDISGLGYRVNGPGPKIIKYELLKLEEQGGQFRGLDRCDTRSANNSAPKWNLLALRRFNLSEENKKKTVFCGVIYYTNKNCQLCCRPAAMPGRATGSLPNLFSSLCISKGSKVPTNATWPNTR